MNDRISVRNKVLQAVYRYAKGLGLDELAKLALDAIKIKADMEGGAVAMKEHLSQVLKANKELQDYIAGDKAVQAVMKAKVRNYDPARVHAVLDTIVSRIESSFMKTKGQEAQFGQLKIRKVEESQSREDVIKDAEERLKAAKEELKNAKAALAEAEKSAKNSVKIIVKTNLNSLYEKLKESAKAAAAEELDAQEKKKKQEKFMKEVEKRKQGPAAPAPAPAKSSSLGATADKDIDAAIADVQQAEEDLQEALSSMADSLEAGDASLDAALSEANAAADMMAAAPAEEEADEPGLLDMLMPMELAPAPAAVENPWIVTSDLKRFPSEHDASGNRIEIVESEQDGKKQIVVRKDLKARVESRIEEMYKGKFSQGQLVGVDLDDRILEGTVLKYAGERKYEVVVAGQKMVMPADKLFCVRRDLWR